MWVGRFEPAEQEARMNNTIATQVRELQHLAADQLAERYAALFGKPPRIRNVAFLRRQVAWKLQERELGGLSERARSRLDELVAGIDLPLRAAQPPRPRPQPQPARPEQKAPLVGTTLVREWHGQKIQVEVADGSFIWNGTPFRSLSAVAKAITGTTWNGRLFFGLTERRAAQ